MYKKKTKKMVKQAYIRLILRLNFINNIYLLALDWKKKQTLGIFWQTSDSNPENHSYMSGFLDNSGTSVCISKLLKKGILLV